MNRNSILLFMTIGFIIAFALCCRDDESPEDILKRKMLIQINKMRLSGCNCGIDTLPPIHVLAWDESLTTAARRHTMDMVTNSFIGHEGSDGSTPAIRAKESGYSGAYIGENVARGYGSVEAVIEAWKNSPSHCRNIMNYRYEYMGVSTKNYYWTLVLGAD